MMGNITSKIEKIFPLTPSQEQMVYSELINTDRNVYLIQNVVPIRGVLDTDLFKRSLNLIVERYEILRTAFIYKKIQRSRQVVLAERELDLYYEDISHMTGSEKTAYIEEFKNNDKNKCFDISKDMLLRVSLLKTDRSNYSLIFTFHHIIMDGWCMAIIAREIFSIYDSLKYQKPINLGPVFPLSNYVDWMEKQDKKEALAYWSKYLEGYKNQATLPKNNQGTDDGRYNLKIIEFTLGEEISKGLRALAINNSVTLNTVFQTIWGILLQKYNGTHDVAFGTIVSGRSPEVEGIDKMIGLFANSIPVRIMCDKNQSFIKVLKDVQKAAIATGKYEYASLADIQATTELNRDLIDHLLVFENYPFKDMEQVYKQDELEIENSRIELLEQTYYNFGVLIDPASNIKIKIGYNTFIYDERYIEKIEHHLKNIVKSVLDDASKSIKELDILSEEEKQQILIEFNKTERTFPDNRTIHELFEEQVVKTPDAIAVEYEEASKLELWPSVAEYFIYDDILYHAMTNDERRNISYRVAINRLVKDKVVVDIGTGADAILARLCVQGGAKIVYALELLDESYRKAKECIAKLGLEDRIIVIHGDATQIELPEKADVCVSEIVGAIGGSEGAAAIINDAWRLLKEDGVMIPSRSSTKIAAVTLPDDFMADPRFSELSGKYTEKVFDYIGHRFDLRVCLKNLSRKYLISDTGIFEELDYSKPIQLQDSHDIRLTINKDSKLQGFTVWLNLFTVEDEVIDILEHEYCWLPVFVPVFYPGIDVYEGDIIEAVCERTLCENKLNPDFKLKGRLIRKCGDPIEFEYEMPHFGKTYRSKPFYQKIFEQDSVKVYDSSLMNKKVTYKELNIKANQMAWYLRSKGIKEGSIVAIMMDKSLEMIAGILGILKAGGTYLPLDPVYFPEDRIVSILEDSKASMLLTKEKIADGFSRIKLQNLEVKEARHVITPIRPQILDFDSIPRPDFSLIDHQKYCQYIGLKLVKNAISIQATRGCPYNCVYCHKIWPKKHVTRSAESIFEEVKFYYDQGFRKFSFIDDIFNFDVKNSSRFFKYIVDNKLKIQIHFPAGLRGDILTKDYIDLMVEAGTVHITLALETASPRLQKLIKKNLNIERLRENMQYIAQKHPSAILQLFTMHGFPTETEEEAMMTLDFIKDVKWIDFPYINVLKIYPNTEMERIALDSGISKEDIMRSLDQAFYELPYTLPFKKEFSIRYRSEYFNDYFLSKERLLSKLPHQMKIMTEDEMIKLYGDYLHPDFKISTFVDILDLADIKRSELPEKYCIDESYGIVRDFEKKSSKNLTKKETVKEDIRILFMDLSQNFAQKNDAMFAHIEAPLGHMYLLTYLNHVYGDRVKGKIVKPIMDFNSYEELKDIVDEFKPDVIGIRTMTYYREMFHKSVSILKEWFPHIPIITGGPYATSSYVDILKDCNIDVVLLGEGEITISELIGKMLDNGAKLPSEEELEKIAGLAFVKSSDRLLQKQNNCEVILVDKLMDTLSSQPVEDLKSACKPDNLAYIIYTSGTTGKPKGVMLRHKGLCNLATAQVRSFGLHKDRILQFASFAFDASVSEIFISLLSQSVLCLVGKEQFLATMDFGQVLGNKAITAVTLPPSILKSLPNANLPALNKVISAGESCTPEIIERWSKGRKLFNAYGPTEATVCTSIFEFNEKESVHNPLIGKPMDNVKVYILDEDLNPVSIGVTGELFVGGVGVADGYLNRPELTEEKFVENPFIPGEKLYRTGDNARWLPDMNIEFLGRIDHQVKIRGFRIELGEIEAKIKDYSSVKEAIVITKEDVLGNKSLYAFLTSDTEISAKTLKWNLSKVLPEYMIPSYFIQVSKMPLTMAGKIDRKALAKMDGYVSEDVEYAPPEDDIEKKLVDMWKELLDVEKISIDGSFFDYGGHSLNATNLVSRIHKTFDVKIPVAVIFEKDTIRALGKYIKEADRKVYYNIPQVEPKDFYELSSAQKRLIALGQITGANTVYNIPGVININGMLDRERFENAFKALLSRHDALRTSFEIVEGEYKQKISKYVDFYINYIEMEEERLRGAVNEFIQPFDLSKAPLLRLCLVKLSENRHVLMFDMHHIISDGVSMNILIKEFANLYANRKLPELRIQYKDFSQWQNSLLKTDFIKKQEEYWINTFKGELPVLNLPTDFTRPLIQSTEGSSIRFEADHETTMHLRQITKETGTTLFMVLMAAYNILLYKYSGQEDIIIGTPIAGRPHSDLEDVIGLFVNNLAMRNFPRGEMTFVEFLSQVKESSLKAYENQDFQFEELINKLKIKRDLGRNPLFDCEFSLQNEGINGIDIDGLKFTPEEFENNTCKFDIALNVQEKEHELVCDLQYCTKLFKRETAQRLGKHFINILRAITENPKVRLHDLDMLSGQEKSQITDDFNNTYASYPYDKTIHELFEDQADKAPGSVALVYEGNTFTYEELKNTTNVMGKMLRDIGVKPNNIIGVLMDNCNEMIIAILSILKAGGAYLPIDPALPLDRIKYILEDSAVKILMTKKSTMEGKIIEGIQLVYLDEVQYPINEPSDIDNVNKPHDLAYVIYTSGSSGRPKGVMIEHKSLVNYCTWHVDTHKIDKNDRIVKYAGVGFDASLCEIFPNLIAGASIHIASQEMRSDLNKLNEYFLKNNITVCFLPTRTAELFMKIDNTSLRLLLTGGEKLKQFTNVGYNVVNNYGPTECTIITIYFYIDKSYGNIPIGKPIANTQIYILDRNNKIQPIGVIGEICISGDSLARGYINSSELMAEKFVDNPYDEGFKIYKTGDFGRWLPDGNIEFWDRMDQQVKLRGYRLELGEIEWQLLECPNIKEAAVTVRKSGKGDSGYICAYVVADEELKEFELREMLKKQLPDYMIPQYFVQLERIPLTVNGKINTEALPEPKRTLEDTVKYVAPSSDMEIILANIWQEILDIKKIGIEDNFFALGGDSIKAMRVCASLQSYNLTLNVKDLFQYPDIRELSKCVQPMRRKAQQGIVTGEVVLTPVQRWFFEKRFTDQHHFNQSFMLFKKDGFDEDALGCAFKKILQHHDALRMTYGKENDRTVQINHGIDGEMYGWKVFDFRSNKDFAKTIEEESNKLQADMDLEKGPLLKVGLFKTIDGDHLLIVIHHLIIDGVSWRILVEDLASAYIQAINGEEIILPEKTDSFMEWASKLDTFANSKNALSELQYWKDMESEQIHMLPRDGMVKYRRVKDCDTVLVTLTDMDTQKLLKQVNRAYNTEINDILLTALGLTIKEWTAQDNVLVNVEGHGREEIFEDVNVTRTLGWFTSMYPIVLNMKKSDDISYIIKFVKETIRRVPNKGVGYGILKYNAAEKNRQGLEFRLDPEISFNYLGQIDTNIKSGIFNTSYLSGGMTLSPNSERLYPLDINAIISDERLLINFSFSKDEYDTSTIQMLADNFRTNLLGLIEHCVCKENTELTPTDLENESLTIEEVQDIADLFNSL